MRAQYGILWCAATGTGVVAALLSVVVIVVGWMPWVFAHSRLPLGDLGGIVADDDAVFVASSSGSRIYKFSLNGHLLKWIDHPAHPLWIHQEGESIVARHGSRETAIEGPAFRVHPSHDVVATVEHNWVWHPYLLVRGPEGTTRASLQPWYLTVVQRPFPGVLHWPAAFALLFLASWAWRHWRSHANEPSAGLGDGRSSASALDGGRERQGHARGR